MAHRTILSLNRILSLIRPPKFTKREKFAIVILLLDFGLIATQLVSFQSRITMVVILAISSYILSAWCLREDLGGVEWLTLLILPTMYTAAVSLFYFLLPVRWLTRLPTAIFYAIGMYALLLTENIYNVAVERSIQLIRAAHSIGLLMTLVTIFLFLSTIFALHLDALRNSILVGVLTFPLFLQSLWSAQLTQRTISSTIWLYAAVSTMIVVETTFVLSFWPLKAIVAALFLTSVVYSLIGVGQLRLLERLFAASIREFVSVTVIVFVLILMITRWG